MSKKNDIYDVSAELAREFGEIGTQSRAEATAKAWEEYNAQILLDARKNARLTQAELAKRIVKITFLKKDGTITTRHATTTPTYAGQFINGNGYCSDARNVVSFIDIDADSSNKWRSFRYERLISWE